MPTRWDRPAHTKAKHDIFVKYLLAWYGILGSSRYVDKIGIFDGFAGPGRYSNDEPGSPLLAVEALLDHSHFPRWDNTEFVFLFNEQDDERFDSLQTVISELKDDRQPWPNNVKIHAHNRRFSDLTEDLLSGIKPGQGLIPLFAFVDPFGYCDAPMDLIKRLLKYDKAELFIYFDYNSVQRFAGKPGSKVNHHFQALFGCDDFLKAPKSGPMRGKFLHDLYEFQLKKECSFAHVRSFAMVNKRGLTGNYLFFCTRNTQAFDRMKQAMWALDPSGEYRFEDRLADQSVLFNPEPDTRPLQKALLTKFGGQTVSIETVTKYVIERTPFHSGHVKVKTLKVMQADRFISSPNQRKVGTFPPGTQIAFTG